jgi:quercetin dioxygenase-like cupin family protein
VTSRLTSSCDAIATLLNYPPSSKKPVIGSGAMGFDGERLVSTLEDLEVNEARLLMMPYLPELVGNHVNAHLGAAAGPEGVRFRLRRLGKTATEDGLKNMAIRCADLALLQRRDVDDKQLVAIHDQVTKGSSGPVAPYMLKNREATEVQMFEGVVRKTLAEGENTMAVEFRFKKGATVPLHRHFNEQIGYVAGGQVDMTVAGTVHHLSAGDSYMIPGNIEHGTHALADSILVDVFHPPRLDYKPS